MAVVPVILNVAAVFAIVTAIIIAIGLIFRIGIPAYVQLILVASVLIFATITFLKPRLMGRSR